MRRNAAIHARTAARGEVIGVVFGHTGQSVAGPLARVGLLQPATQPPDSAQSRTVAGCLHQGQGGKVIERKIAPSDGAGKGG